MAATTGLGSAMVTSLATQRCTATVAETELRLPCPEPRLGRLDLAHCFVLSSLPALKL